MDTKGKRVVGGDIAIIVPKEVCHEGWYTNVEYHICYARVREMSEGEKILESVRAGNY